MASLLALSTELKLDIIEYLDLPPNTYIPGPSPDLLSLSRVCKVLRTLCLSLLLKNITPINTSKSGSSVLSILNGPHAHLVRIVHYIGIKALPDLSFNDKATIPPSEDDFPDSVAQVLSRLGEFPRLERVIMEFACASTLEDDVEMTRNNFNVDERTETDEQVVKIEATSAMRSLMNRSYLALCQAPSSIPCFKNLELRNLMLQRCSAFISPSFLSLLRGLEEFSISLRGGNAAGWRINMVPAYGDFVSSLDHDFFQHLVNMRCLSVKATESGVPDGYIDVLGLKSDGVQYMPQLQTLELEHVFITRDMATFISARTQTLREVRLGKCYSAWPDRSAWAITWEDLFTAISSSITSATSPSSLRMFEIATSTVESLDPATAELYNSEDSNIAYGLKEMFPGRRMWDYMHLDDEYGFLIGNPTWAFERFFGGEDWAAWVRLKDLIKRNGEAR